jgi:hypothetical protein
MSTRPPTSPRQNRVLPTGEIVAVAQRGAWLGNRGIVHDGVGDQARVVRLHRGPLWIICALQHKDWRLPQWQAHHFTVLFFHDEAVAMAAGHRPCALCRRSAYNAYREAWVGANGLFEGRVPRAFEMDRRLHSERLVHRTRIKRIHRRSWWSLPDGAFVLSDSAPTAGPALVWGDVVVPWSTEGYVAPVDRPRRGEVDVLTPPSTLGVLRAGYVPQVDPAAGVSVRECLELDADQRG